ncbi:MAG: hypothetical protein H6868_00790 [Rhodospirillales bacterium]|nr:hypothetical protein [Rhodospirillales bacterium]
MFVASFKSTLSGCLRKAALTFSSLMLLTALSACVSLNKQAPPETTYASQKTLDNMLKLSDLNERAFAYQQHCLQETEPMSEVFLDNFKATSDMLFDECIHTLKWPPDLVVSRVLERREHIQRLLDDTYSKENGCDSEEAVIAGEHYRAFSQARKDSISDFVFPETR